METKQYNSLFSFIWNIANDVLVHAFERVITRKSSCLSWCFVE